MKKYLMKCMFWAFIGVISATGQQYEPPCPGQICAGEAVCPDPSGQNSSGSTKSCSDYNGDQEACDLNRNLPAEQAGGCEPGDHLTCTSEGANKEDQCSWATHAHPTTKCGTYEINCAGEDSCVYNSDTDRCEATDTGGDCAPTNCARECISNTE